MIGQLSDEVLLSIFRYYLDASPSICLMQPGAPTYLQLRLFCEPVSGQLFSMVRFYFRFLAPLFNVEDLRISAARPPRWNVSGHWLRLIRSLTGVKWFHVTGTLSKIVRALRLSERLRETVLPALRKLYILQPGPRHSPLREAVLPLMTPRQLPGHPIGTEYERLLRHINELRGTEPFSQRVTIEILSKDSLLKIFRYCLDTTPRYWPTLASVCRKWRQIVLGLPLGPNHRLHCTHGTPVLKTLDFLPALPIVVQYGGSPTLDPPAPEDEDNIIAALKQSDRASTIGLTITTSLMGKLSAIEEPFLRLEELVLRSPDNTQLTLPSTFRWGTRLRRLHSTRISLPALPQLLSSSENLVDLKLHEIGYFSPEALADGLSRMTQLQSLSLHFLSSRLPHKSHWYISCSWGTRCSSRSFLPQISRNKRVPKRPCD
ncbi:hypothetical protein EDB83DRAFT_1872334 [Lactarius deliciosus]|nr:hypothetical protein EDB83DRAFT_1872334 [Lactarius deliciosus]